MPRQTVGAFSSEVESGSRQKERAKIKNPERRSDAVGTKKAPTLLVTGRENRKIHVEGELKHQGDR
jgi:hypothetical protein